jgi:curved DNA-binding protein CbpA
MESDGLDYYTLLGIDSSASPDEIGRAYRAAARATHPDIHPDEPSSGGRFTAITSAYETLSDPARRAAYDHRARPADARAYRVEPVSAAKRKTTVVPIPPRRAPRPHPEPLQAPVPIELAASWSRLLRWTWRSL